MVMLVLAVPASSYELGRDLGGSGHSVSATATDSGHMDCPCCPDHDSSEGKSGFDNCSTCSYCFFYAPLSAQVSMHYAPSVSELATHDTYLKLLDVYIPIEIPPQELS